MTDPLLNLIVVSILITVGLGLFWPDKGMFWYWKRTRQMTQRVLIEDTLKHFFDCENNMRPPTMQSIAGVLNSPINEVVELTTTMQSQGLVKFEGDKLGLTPQGRDYALHVIRAHRLWERYLADKTGYAETEWHSQSELREHDLTPIQADALSSKLGHPRYDPHGDPIPTAEGEVIEPELYPLPGFPLNQPALIVHLEDEPETVYAQLVAEGVHLGMQLLVTEISPQRVRFWANGNEHILAPLIAANISVTPIKQDEVVQIQSFETLSSLKPGKAATVVNISRGSRAAERRRLMDLGILPGTTVKAEMVSPGGDPTAYRIRGALIGLRKEQADLINITQELETI